MSSSPFAPSWGSPCGFYDSFGSPLTLPGCVRTVCLDSRHSHFLLRALLPLDPQLPPPIGSSGPTMLLASSFPLLLLFHMPGVSLLIQGKYYSSEIPYLPNILAQNRVLYSPPKAVSLLEIKARKSNLFLLHLP